MFSNISVVWGVDNILIFFQSDSWLAATQLPHSVYMQ